MFSLLCCCFPRFRRRRETFKAEPDIQENEAILEDLSKRNVASKETQESSEEIFNEEIQKSLENEFLGFDYSDESIIDESESEEVEFPLPLDENTIEHYVENGYQPINRCSEVYMPSHTFRTSEVKCIKFYGNSFAKNDYLCGNKSGLILEIEDDNVNYSRNQTLSLAQTYKMLSGKWIIHIANTLLLDHVWQLIVNRIVLNEFNGLSNYALIMESSNQVCAILIFNKDCTNMEEIYALETILREIGVRFKMHYRPDIYVFAEAYGKSSTSVRQALYVSNYDSFAQKTRIIRPKLKKATKPS